ncbi:hypothetical protein BU24DRAFT_469138 [Aaosphaeria arxii CBS 175.79]|uniref:Uncharacterized protein n=1 Tax=Aaosphaeria arxii CBS 175.79 TaxID=1450172 RepID=A0A6A5Y710_9PLEO|nr:uncharacterized protein BU24DRAFT_469138 [Aaosphaeria arxii CBS 175.79]KAF2020344.1 hypothetical protein BU24DRAFT_469138 [Aaosphaeria arxii CBS 175.79]
MPRVAPLSLCYAQLVKGSWPNSFPKQLATSRRRPGLTQAEYLYHHTIVHGQKAWNAPDTEDQPLTYIQDLVFDSAYGINTSVPALSPSFVGHQDITELYSRSEVAFRLPPVNNYTASVIGPDGLSFNDLPVTLSLYAYETFRAVQTKCTKKPTTPFHAFFWAFGAAANANTIVFNNATFADAIANTLLDALPSGSIYNLSIHTPIADLDSRPYYGGLNHPTVNAVLKFWLCNDNTSVFAFRKAQLGLIEKNNQLGLDLSNTFVQFTRQTVIYDRTVGQGVRGDVVLNGPAF